MKRLSFSAVVLVLVQLAYVASVSAHPGHGPGDVPPAHLMTSADHLGALLVISVVGLCLVNARRWFNRNSKAT